MGSISKGVSKPKSLKIAKGAYAEKLACEYLQKEGLQLIEKNFRVKCGEIDLIMRDKAYLIFIEVRFRKNNFFGGALESITWRKQQRLIHAAQIFSFKHPLAKTLPSRFDVVTLTGDLRKPEILWIEDAFRLDS
jgi:putative endonuclease